MLFPQEEQNFAPAGFSLLQWGHKMVSVIFSSIRNIINWIAIFIIGKILMQVNKSDFYSFRDSVGGVNDKNLIPKLNKSGVRFLHT